MACVDREADSSRRAYFMGMEMIFMVRTLLIVLATFVGVSHLSAQPLEYFGKPVRGIPVSGAVKVGKFVFVSGTPAFGKGGKLAVGDFSAQMKQVMENMTGVLKASGTDWSRVVKTNVLFMRASDFSEMNQIYSTYFAEGKYPARTTTVVAGLPHPVLHLAKRIKHPRLVPALVMIYLFRCTAPRQLPRTTMFPPRVRT